MRKVGFAALEDRQEKQLKYSTIGSEIQLLASEELNDKIEQLRRQLLEFARVHKHQICANRTFQTKFARICGRLGVDPLTHILTADNKSSWYNILDSHSSDYHSWLAVRIVEICRATREDNGGILALSQLQSLLKADESYGVSLEDVAKSLKLLEVLGPGLTIETLPNGSQFIRSIPEELKSDQADVLAACEALGYVDVRLLSDNFKWPSERIVDTLRKMVESGLLWIDTQSEEPTYWHLAAIL